MKKSVKNLLFAFGIILVSSIFLSIPVYATDTELTIKTLPTYSVSISILKPDSVYSLIDSFHKETDANGEVKIIFSASLSEVDVKFWLKENGKSVYSERQGPFPTGAPIIIDLVTEDETPPEENQTTENIIENQTVEVNMEETETEGEPNINSGITGKTVSDIGDGMKISTIIYFVAGIVVIAGVLFFLLMSKKPAFSNSKPTEPKIVPLSELRNSGTSRDSGILSSAEKKLEKAEKELKQAKEEIYEIKHQKDEIKEAEEQLRKAQERVKKLKGE